MRFRINCFTMRGIMITSVHKARIATIVLALSLGLFYIITKWYWADGEYETPVIPKQLVPPQDDINNEYYIPDIDDDDEEEVEVEIPEGNINGEFNIPEIPKVVEIPQEDLNDEYEVTEVPSEVEIPQETVKNVDQRVAYRSSGSLKFNAGNFYLNGVPLTIISGAMHYFRVVPEYWQDRMLKMKACGLNTLETYVSWNLHEEYPGEFNFEGILNIRQYIKTAQKVGLYVILRPGPYICSEWDFGGLPAWLLRDPAMKVRSNYEPYMEAVDRFFHRLFMEVVDLQYSKGGPIIAFQIENEFASYSHEVEHLSFLKSCMIKYGVDELFLTSDGVLNEGDITERNAQFFEHALVTANFQSFRNGKLLFEEIRKLAPEFPFMTMEFWSGWFDHWGKRHSSVSTGEFVNNLIEMLNFGASVNFYMFHGGTNFGFMSGSNYFPNTGFNADTTSYDYDCLLSEAGDLTEKYYKAREIFSRLLNASTGNTLPQPPPNTPKFAYGVVHIQHVLSFEDMLNLVRKSFTLDASYLVPMEMLNLYGNYGQNFGYILYRTTIIGKVGSVLKFSAPAKDRVQVFLNRKLVYGSGWWPRDNLKLSIVNGSQQQENQLDLLVENHGRVNFIRQGLGSFEVERKGITGEVFLDNEVLKKWQIFPLDFRRDYMERVLKSNNWKDFITPIAAPSLYRTNLNIYGTPQDTFLLMKDWGKGIVFVNGFNLGRYWSVGPQRTLFVPAPILKSGTNSIIIFEHTKAGTDISFQDTPILDHVG